MLSFAENCSPSLSVVGDEIAGFEQGQNPVTSRTDLAA